MMINWENNLKGLGEYLTHDKYWTCVGYYYILCTYVQSTYVLMYFVHMEPKHLSSSTIEVGDQPNFS